MNSQSIKKQSFLLIITNDITIIEAIKTVFDKNEISIYKEEEDFKKYNLIILDDFDLKEEIIEKLSDLDVINISSLAYKNFININRPFPLKELFTVIENFLYNNTIIKFSDFKIVGNILYHNNENIALGNKEISLVKFLNDNATSTKDTLLKEIWGINCDLETKVLENTINKVRQKFKSTGINDFIIYEDNKFKINEIYLTQKL